MKTAIVTGGSRGIGASICQKLASRGYNIISISRGISEHVSLMEKTCLEYGVNFKPLYCDLSDYENLSELFYKLDKILVNGLDVLVNNAGAAELGPLSSISEVSVLRQATINYISPALLIKTLQMQLSKCNGSVINISSINASSSTPNSAMYCSSKSALEMLTKSLAFELGQLGIRINAIAPGCTDTDLFRNVTDQNIREQISKATPLGRLGSPEDIAEVVSFLTEHKSKWITGEVITVSGGLN